MKIPKDLKRKAHAYARKQYCNADCKDPRIKWAIEITEQDFIAGYKQCYEDIIQHIIDEQYKKMGTSKADLMNDLLNYGSFIFPEPTCQPPVNQDVELMGGGK